MNINDYKSAAKRVEIRPECKERVIRMSVEKNNSKHRFSKRKMLPILAAAVVGCVAVTAAMADDFMGIFKKQPNFEMNISSVAEPQKKEVSIMDAVWKKWDEQKIYSLFSEGKNVVANEESISDLNPDGLLKWFKYDDNSTLSFEDSNVRYYFNSYYDYRSMASRMFENCNINNGEPYFFEGVIDGLDMSAAIGEADAIINELGISVCSPTVYALDAEHLKAAEMARNENGERIDKHENVLPEWTEQQEAYLIVYQVNEGDIPITQKTARIEGYGVEGPKVYAVIGRNGLEVFLAENLYDTSVSEKQAIEICTAEEAAEAVNTRFSQETAEYLTTIEDCNLVYMPVLDEYGKTELKPFWEFYSTEKKFWDTAETGKLDIDYYDTLFVDAGSCEILGN